MELSKNLIEYVQDLYIQNYKMCVGSVYWKQYMTGINFLKIRDIPCSSTISNRKEQTTDSSNGIHET